MGVSFSICYILFAGHSLEEFLKVANELKFDGVDVNTRVLFKYIKSVDKYKKLLELYNLKHSGSYWSNKFHIKTLHEKILEEARGQLKILSKLESHNLIIGPPERFEGLQIKHIKNMAIILNKIGRMGQDYDIKIGVHNHYGTIIEQPHELEALMEFTDPEYVGFVPDTAHLGVAGFDVIDVFKKYLDRIVYVHLKDIIHPGEFVPRTEKWNVRIRDLGRGDIDFITIMKLLKKRNYNGWLAYEQDFSINPFQSAKNSKEFIDKVLKPIIG